MSFVKEYTLLETDAPADVEIFFNLLPTDNSERPRYILQVLNLSGYNGKTFKEGHAIRDIEVNLRNLETLPGTAYSLSDKTTIDYEVRDNTFSMKIPPFQIYNALILE